MLVEVVPAGVVFVVCLRTVRCVRCFAAGFLVVVVVAAVDVLVASWAIAAVPTKPSAKTSETIFFINANSPVEQML